MSDLADIFLSYAPKDRKAARRLGRQLAADGFSVWSELLPGDDLHRKTSRAIQGARFFLMLFSQEYDRSETFAELLTRSQELKGPGTTIIPVRLDHTPLPEPISHLMSVDLFEDYSAGYDFLLRGLRGRQPSFTGTAPARSVTVSEEGASLLQLQLDQIGMSERLVYEPDDRLNIITGDNSLGKTFLLECIFWALTGQWLEQPAMPRRDADKGEPQIRFEVGHRRNSEPDAVSYGHKAIADYDWDRQVWDLGRDAIRLSGLLVYARHDGSFAIWDPLRTSAEGHPSDPGEPIHLFLTRTQVRDGLPSASQLDKSRWLCNGLLRDWVTWQHGGSRHARQFEAFTSCLKTLSPPNSPLTAGESIRLPGDTREIPTLHAPYGDVPLVHLSAGMQRIVSLAYILVWTWQEHLTLCELARRKPLRRLLLLVDEAEAHLHPRWQRSIVPALMSVIEEMSSRIRPQVHLATHSPLILASAEEIFDPERDQLFNLRLDKANVVLDRKDFVRRGTVDSWLTSDTFGLDHARSGLAARAIEDAKQLQESDEPSPDRVREVNARLIKALASDDDFWPRWRYFARQHGVES